MLTEFKKLPIWQQFEHAKVKEEIVYDLDGLFQDAISLLARFYVAFPHYTLHNDRHVYNVIKLAGQLLGDEVRKLTALECALIILSAAYHDIGMVFNEKQLLEIEKEDNFQQFLSENLDAKIKYEENEKKLSKDLAGWYCRWTHAKRVWLFLDEVEKNKWGQISLKGVLGKLCESHNDNAISLINDQNYSTEFLGKADVRFCAVLLRLGDILDFDNSRTSKSVYEFLDLDNPKNKSEQISKDEWNKHLCSDGFTIQHNEERTSLRFQAGPLHPQIENNINEFLDIIEDELENCTRVVDKCSAKWREFKLPNNINRSDIISQGYKKGNYRLSLDENQIIKLLTGENLYDESFVFIRELLQNAIDTSRMREFHEISNSNSSFKASPILINTWVDEMGYRWVRVDDFGMGINEYVITNHLLKKGTSFYQSSYFKIQKKHYRDIIKQDFTPISRFGIGLLSCFILGDAIELNTKSIAVTATGSLEEKNRLSIQGLQGYYILQTAKDNHVPNYMPSNVYSNEGFRNDYGTSIAVRIDKAKDHLYFEEGLLQIIKYYAFCSPIDILYEGNKIGIDFNNVLYHPFATSKFYPFSDLDKEEIEEVIGVNIKSEIGIEILSIDITANSATPNLKGQLLFIQLKCDDFLKSSYNSWHYSIGIRKNAKYIDFERKIIDPDTREEDDLGVRIDLKDAFKDAIDTDLFDNLFLKGENYSDRLYIIHNGIQVPNFSSRDYAKLSFLGRIFGYNSYYDYNPRSLACFGLIYLQDKLIPNISIARNTIKSLGFNIYSSLYYATRQLNNRDTTRGHFYHYFEENDMFGLHEVFHDELVINNMWDSERVINTPNGYLSINDIKEKIKREKISFSFPPRGIRFLHALVRGLIEINFEIEYLLEEGHFIIEGVKSQTSIKLNDDSIYLMYFVRFNKDFPIVSNEFINEKHWLSRWLIINNYYLMNNFKSYFSNLVRLLLEEDIDGINKVLDYFKKVLPNELKPQNIAITKKDFETPSI
ncbi:HD domain-containing protein [Chitinophagaceae bacterium MMS25-I14]